MDARQRRELHRYGTPAAFLVAVTIAVLLIKSGLGGGHGGSTTTHVQPPTRTATRETTTHSTSTTSAAARYYVIQSGDTFGSVAAAQSTSVDALLRLNPGVDPRALHVGQRIRVG